MAGGTHTYTCSRVTVQFFRRREKRHNLKKKTSINYELEHRTDIGQEGIVKDRTAIVSIGH